MGSARQQHVEAAALNAKSNRDRLVGRGRSLSMRVLGLQHNDKNATTPRLESC